MLFMANILKVLPFEIKAEKNMFASTIRIISLPLTTFHTFLPSFC
jgi:hypothetical protein